MKQHTVLKPVTCEGVGVHSGEGAHMTILPGTPDSGIRFVRTDVTDRDPIIPGKWDHVVDTQLCTVLSNTDQVTISTVEHLLAALRGCGVDNAIIEIDGPEIPIMDGSAAPFVDMIDDAGLLNQETPQKAIRIKKEVTYTEGDKTAILKPADLAGFSFEIDFDNPIIGQQQKTVQLVNGTFRSEISQARTFGFMHEVEHLRKLGLARGGSLDNAIVIDGDKILNEGGLRFKDEFVRHKILDSIGDLYLAGAPIIGHFHGIRAGHMMNNKILHELFKNDENWEMVEMTRLADHIAQAETTAQHA